MKHNRLFLTILCIPSLLITSCKKEEIVKGNFKPTIVHVTMQHDADNMPFNWSFNCYPSDKKSTYDSDFVYSTTSPDTLALKAYLRMNFHYPTGKVDSSFSKVILNDGSILTLSDTVFLPGPIEHRDYTFVGHINWITYGSME